MDKDDTLARVAKAVQGARSAFQDLCSDYRDVIKVPDSHHILALDVDLQALGSIFERLNGIDPGDGNYERIYSLLATPVTVSASENQNSMADALISDMRNLNRRLIDVRAIMTTTESMSPESSGKHFPPREAMSIGRMVKKYYSIISEVLNSQVLCVVALSVGVFVLTL
jgi:hypothetical protein